MAVADLSGDGRPDLVVLSGSRYRVGRSLDSAGAVAGGWGEWLDIPGWLLATCVGLTLGLLTATLLWMNVPESSSATALFRVSNQQ